MPAALPVLPSGHAPTLRSGRPRHYGGAFAWAGTVIGRKPRIQPRHYSRAGPDRDQERDLHAAVADFLRLALRPPTTWTTFPAGGGGRARGRMLARLGLRPGWPDVLVLHP